MDQVKDNCELDDIPVSHNMMFSVSAVPTILYGNSSAIFNDSQDDSSSYWLNLALVVIFLIVSARLARLKTRSISPPCEKIIEEAERTNRRNGHENAGFLSKEAAFSPLQTIKALPPSHALWDQLAADLPRLVQTQTVRETVIKMPLLDASTKTLHDIYLQRAATILGMTAHVFVRMEGSEPLTLKYDSHSDILPPSLEIPWTVVCRRLGRPAPALTYVDGVVSNFTSTSLWHSGVALDNLELLVPTVGTKEEHTFVGIMIEINAKTIPILYQVIEAQRSVLAKDSSSLKDAIRRLHALLRQITETLNKLHASRAHKTHIDPVLWTLTVGNLGIPWVKGMVGAAGTAHPLFHMMDEFTGRFEYNTGIGQEAQIVRATYPIHWRQFLEAMKEVSVSEYIALSKDRELMDLWRTFTSSYHGNDGLLGFHRRKVFGFLAVSFRIGRSTTINGLGRKRRTEPWHEVDQELEEARLERRCLDPDEHILDSEPSSNKLFMSQLIKHNSEETGYWFSAKERVYDASAFMQRHPGGDTVIALCSGQDVTDSLKAVGHLMNASIRNKLESYRIGTLEKPKFASSHAEEVYMAAVDLGQKAAEMETVQRRNLQLLNGKLTIMDEPETLTPKKERHLLDAKNRLRDEHVPVLVTLLGSLLDSIAKLDMKLDLSGIRAQVVGLATPGTGLGTATRFLDYEMALDMLHKDLSRLAEVKELAAMVLGAFENPGFTYSGQSRLESIMGTLSRVASQLIVLGK